MVNNTIDGHAADWGYHLTDRHMEGCNVMYLDGHIGYIFDVYTSKARTKQGVGFNTWYHGYNDYCSFAWFEAGNPDELH